MEKIKINLVSGSSLEKPLVSAFRSNNASYVVFDNEINGTMGLPIILVSKLDNNKLTKIVDQNEWNAVKENLRMIIAGNQMDYITIEPMLAADDMFFSQLTLPMASFDALKNNYHPNVVGANVGQVDNASINPVPEVTPVANASVTPTPVSPENVGPQVNPEPMVMPNPQNVEPDVAPAQPVVEVAPAVETVAPVMPSAPVDAQNVAPVDVNPMPEVNTLVAPESPAPVVEPIPEETNTSAPAPIDFTADKEAFLKACENMFDALVAKFKN